MKKLLFLGSTILLSSLFSACDNTDDPIESEILYTFPEESEPHEGTWLQWPHQYQYGLDFRNSLDPAWVAMTRELIESENVHIIAYDQTEQDRITSLLTTEGVDLTNVDFKIYPNDDFWVRDNGPIYARDLDGNLIIQDWGFNGWGSKADYEQCDLVPNKIAQDQNRTVVDLNGIMINEGGSVEIDGHGTMMACKSSILNNNRNPGMSQSEAEAIFKTYYGVTHFVWLEGQAGLDITDQHIDGFARFANESTIVTMDNTDLLYFDVMQSDIDILYAATNKEGNPYTFVQVPLTQNDVITADGQNHGRASYCNYYIANTKVLVPIYDDPNDATALQQIQTLYPNRTVVGIDCQEVYAYGGMIHCVTQQQPVD